jgi:hypothetical protein
MKKQKAKQNSPAARQYQDQRQEDDIKSISTYDGESKTSLFSDSDETPVRPPRKKKKNRITGSGTESSVPGSILQRRRSIRSSNRSNRSNRSIRRGRPGPGPGPGVSYNPSGPASFVSDQPLRRSGQRLRRSDSKGQSDFSRRSARRSSRGSNPPRVGGFMTGGSKAQGDVYTRVAIPRSKSFMNVNSQYNLQELFKELKEKEGVESIDDVLKKIISKDGISFNEIKPVYRELLLKLAMTMSQDELFQRSKNIMSQEKKKTKGKTKKDKTSAKSSSSKSSSKSSKKEYPASASEQSTLSSFLRLTFSSNKHQIAAAPENLSKSKSMTSTDISVSKISTDRKKGKGISKTDISGPIPIHPPPSLGSKTPRTSRKATSPLPPPPISSSSPSSSSNSSSHKSYSNNNKQHKPHLKMPTKKPPSPDELVDDAYVSCSECGYESVCTYDSCPCGQGDQIPPPKAYQSQAAILPIVPQPKSHVEDSDSLCDCDADSCVSSEKCYCSIRKDPRQSTPSKSRPSSIMNLQKKPLATIPSDSESCCTSNHFSTSDMSDTATDTTCYSVRHVPLKEHQQQEHQHQHQHQHQHHEHLSLSGAETPQTAWRRNSSKPMRTSPDTNGGSDTYSDAGVTLHSGSSASSSGAGSCKMCRIHHQAHHDDDDHSNLTRKNSGGSGYQSNDSCCSSHAHYHSHGHTPSSMNGSPSCQCTSACSSCQTSLAGSLMSRRPRPRLSLVPSQHSHSHVNLSAAGLGSPMERSPRGRSTSPQKVLVVSAIDKKGKVRLQIYSMSFPVPKSSMNLPLL